MKLKITPIGNSFGVILPREVIARLKVSRGDSLFITETPDGYSMSAYDPKFEQVMKAGHEVMKKRRNMLHQMAKL
jgi:putative addiction module antidote